VLGRLGRHVDTIEVVPDLAHRARRALRELGITNVEVHLGDGWAGLPSRPRSIASSSPPRRIACPRRSSISSPREVCSLSPSDRSRTTSGWSVTRSAMGASCEKI